MQKRRGGIVGTAHVEQWRAACASSGRLAAAIAGARIAHFEEVADGNRADARAGDRPGSVMVVSPGAGVAVGLPTAAPVAARATDVLQRTPNLRAVPPCVALRHAPPTSGLPARLEATVLLRNESDESDAAFCASLVPAEGSTPSLQLASVLPPVGLVPSGGTVAVRVALPPAAPPTERTDSSNGDAHGEARCGTLRVLSASVPPESALADRGHVSAFDRAWAEGQATASSAAVALLEVDVVSAARGARP